ncbi:MAG: efflux RND transporter periplasmic adaptor subunit, partial [Planctomycetota bacterium]
MGKRKPGDEKHSEKPSRAGRRGLLISLSVVAVVALAVLAIVFLLPRQSREAVPTEPKPVNVEVMVVEPVPSLPDAFTAPGDVEPNRVVNVAAEVSARIEDFPVKEGERVGPGDVICRLNTDLLQAEVDRTRAQADYDRSEYERLLAVSQRDAATPREVERAGAAMEVSKAAYESAVAKLERTTIEAPAGGVLDRRPVEVGEYVAPGTVVGRIVDTSNVKVVVAVPERDVHFLREGDRARVIHDRGRAEGPITYISELADEQTRTSRVEVTIENPDRALRPGQMVRVAFVRRELTEVLMIPLSAVVRMEDSYAVYVEQDGEARRREVERGVIIGQWVQITEG